MATKLSFRQKISRVINRSYGVYLRKIRGVDVGKIVKFLGELLLIGRILKVYILVMELGWLWKR